MPDDLDLRAQFAASVATLGSRFPQLVFAFDNPGAPGIVYASADPKDNAGLTLQIGTTLTTSLTPGAPVSFDQAPNVTNSLIYLDLGPLNLSDAEFNYIDVAVTSGWAALHLANRNLCLAPNPVGYPSQIPLAAGTDGIAVAITGLAMAHPPKTNQVQLSLTYCNIAGIADGDGDLGALGFALLSPPDAHDKDLHADIELHVQPNLVVCSKDPYQPVANTLTLQLSPRGYAVVTGPDTMFEVKFLCADKWPGFGALCTAKQAAAVKPARGANADAWDPPGHDGGLITLKPPNGVPLVGTGALAVVDFTIGNVITDLAPGPTLMIVIYSGIPTYQDGSFQIVLTKAPHVAIPTLTVTPNPAQIVDPNGVAVTVDWVATDAGALRLTSTAGLDQDVTGRTIYPVTGSDPLLLLKQTTVFTLAADGLVLADLDNKATKPATAVVTPHIDFSAAVLPNGAAQLSWLILGAAWARIEGIDDLHPSQSNTTITPTPPNPLSASFTLIALDADKKTELARATITTPHIDFSAVISPAGAVQLSWTVVGAVYAQLNGSSDLLNLQGRTTITPTAENPLGSSVTLAALDAGKNILASATLKRRWSVGRTVRVGGSAMWTGQRANTIAVAPDGKRLYTVSGDPPNWSLCVVDTGTLQAVAQIPTWTDTPASIALSADSTQIYTLSMNRRFSVIDATSHAVTNSMGATDETAYNMSPGGGLAANDRYIFMRLRGTGKSSYSMVLTLAVNWACTNAEGWRNHYGQIGWAGEGIPSSHPEFSNSLALTRDRLYYAFSNCVKSIDCNDCHTTYKVIETVDMTVGENAQLVATPDASRLFLINDDFNVTTYQGPSWTNPKPLPVVPFAHCQGLAVTSDGLQGLLLWNAPGDTVNSLVQVVELNSETGSYSQVETLLHAAGRLVAIAMAADNSRCFVGLMDSNYGNAAIMELVPDYAG